MPVWAFLAMVIGGFILFGVLYDRLTQKKRTSRELQITSSVASGSQTVYTETFRNEARNDMQNQQL